MLRQILIVLFIACLAACAGEASQAEEDCLNVAEAVRTGAARCGLDPDSEYETFINLVGGCDQAERIRDRPMLIDVCIPALEGTSTSSTSCEDLVAGKLDSSCLNQIEREKTER